MTEFDYIGSLLCIADGLLFVAYGNLPHGALRTAALITASVLLGMFFNRKSI